VILSPHSDPVATHWSY